MPKDSYQISQTTAKWLIQFCTKLIRMGTGINWKPILMENMEEPIGEPGYYNCMKADGHLPRYIVDWVGGLMIVAKTIAGILAYQYEPEEVPPMLTGIDEIDPGLIGNDMIKMDYVPDIDLDDIK